jgi:4,5-DOPA dioxygenase extradiol
MKVQPSLFLSHGAPDLALADSPARRFLAALPSRLERPDAILIASAHHEASGASVRAPARFSTWHDFGGFDPRLQAVRYEPPGATALADEAAGLLAKAGFAPARDPGDRIDHGAWVPLSLLFPAADVPLAMVSIDPRRDARWHERLGLALAPLRARNVLTIGSGSISHNLSEVFRPSGDDRGWVEAFTSWLAEAAERGEREKLLDAAGQAPEAARNHPTDEHLLPFYFALGAGGKDGAGARLHHSYTYEVLAMDAYAFGEPELVARLAQAGRRIAP